MAPATSFDGEAQRLGLAPGEIEGAGHRLRTYANTHLQTSPAHPADARLHVYLDGDGRPFMRRLQVARDPTPRDPLTLQLLAADPGPAIYLGRPCYHGRDADCDPRLWTTARYGDTIVGSLTAAIAAIIEERAPARVVLIGYSGGGALAVLIADRLQSVDAVVTIAANLDTDAWTRHHGYTPLVESLNPARADWQRQVAQLHFAGAVDTNVPPDLQAAFAARLPDAEFRTVEGFGHRCCWVDAWPVRLLEIDAFVTGKDRATAPR